MPLFRSSLYIALLVCWPALAGDLYVNHETGDDRSGGLAKDHPLRTIKAGVKLAKPGDTVHLAPTATPYRESVELLNRAGEPGRPITVDGHGATVYGSDPLNVALWTQVSPGLWRSDSFHKSIRADDAVVGRYFFLFNGRMERMGRTSKGAKAPFKKPEQLKAGEWTFVDADKTFFLKIDPSLSLEAAKIEAPVRSSGVAISGKNCEHLVVRNLTATHVYNDGYNIHGRCRDVRFENIRAIECGDDGVSAHDDCRIAVDGLLSFGNSTGITNVGASESENDHVVIVGCHGFGFYMLNTGKHTLRNSYIDANIPRPFSVSGGDKASATPDAPCHVEVENVLLVATGKAKPMAFHVGPLGEVVARRLTSVNLGWIVQGKADVQESVIVGERSAGLEIRAGAQWNADQNYYSLRHLRLDQTFYATAEQFAQYVGATHHDGHSQWTTASEGLAKIPSKTASFHWGADPSLAPSPRAIPVSSEASSGDRE